MFDTFPQLETQNLILRQIKSSDIEAVFAFFSDADVLRYHDAEPFANLERARRLVSTWHDRFLTRQGIRWGIARKEENTIIGTCGFRFWGKPPFCAELGYELSKSDWRKGIMTEALSSVIRFGFENMELNRIEATVMVDNQASINLLSKLGFTEEGILREFGYWKYEFHDLKLFSLLKRECLQK
ncbi:MAG: GNAT family N-acetyltransferase [Calothrix sp. C42_A2020_038]|nr:GNAT family N-acetyltransferase [Calothrix sp. C42_A2020_038]